MIKFSFQEMERATGLSAPSRTTRVALPFSLESEMILCNWRSLSPASLQRIRDSICAHRQTWHLSAPHCTSWLVIARFPFSFVSVSFLSFQVLLPPFFFVFSSELPLRLDPCHWFHNWMALWGMSRTLPDNVASTTPKATINFACHWTTISYTRCSMAEVFAVSQKNYAG